MKKYFSLIMTAIISVMVFSFVGCDDLFEDEKTDNPVKIDYNGRTLYHSFSFTDISTPSLHYSPSKGVMQFNVFLFEKQWELGGEAKVKCNVEVKSFDANKARKGTKLEIITSRYTWLQEYETNMSDSANSKCFFKVTDGGITFEAMETNNRVRLKVNMTLTNEATGESRIIKGTMRCHYGSSNTYTIEKYYDSDSPNYPYPYENNPLTDEEDGTIWN